MKKILSFIIVSLVLIQANAQNCPKSINVITPSQITEGDSLVFTAFVSGTTLDVTYNWSVSAGWIMSGQGTSSIIVNTDSLGGMTVTATVDLGGLPRDCNSAASSTTEILAAPVKIIAADYTTPQALTASVKKYITQSDLKNIDVVQTAFIYLYTGPSTTATQLKLMKTTIKNAFEKNGVFSYKYTIADGGKKKKASYEIYKMLQGMSDPKPSH